jgi:predicted alpha/beta-hydrolase family hydrolase
MVARSPVDGLVLFHGAGGDRNHRLFLAMEAAMDVPVARLEFPYRQKGPGRRPPDRMPVLQASAVEQIEATAAEWRTTTDRLVIGGRSMGGRVCSMIVADGLAVAGLLLLSYPLHPPGKPEKLRTEHFGALDCPILLIQGASDPFGKEPEFAEHLPAISGPVDQLWLPRTGHDPVARCDEDVIERTQGWMAGLG